MDKLAVIYWSGTGNTEAMAQAILEGAKEASNAQLFSVSDISAEEASLYDKLALGCPSMGDEGLKKASSSPFLKSLRVKSPAKNSTFRLIRLGRRRVDERLAAAC